MLKIKIYFMTNETIIKIMAIAKDFTAREQGNAIRILAKQGIFIDIAGIDWSRKQLDMMKQEKRIYLFGFDPLENTKR